MPSSVLRKVLKEFIYGGHLLSLGAASIVWTVVILTNQPSDLSLYFLAYLVSQIVYNFDHLSDLIKTNKKANAERTGYLEKTKYFQIATFVIYIAAFLFMSRHTTASAFWLASAIVAGGILYTLKAKKITKEILGFKNLYIAFF